MEQNFTIVKGIDNINNIIIKSCYFYDLISDSPSKGSAISAIGKSRVIIKYCIINSCAADTGGAIYLEQSGVEIKNVCSQRTNARLNENSGGNAFFFKSCNLALSLTSVHRCAESLNECGDATIWVGKMNSNCYDINISKCNGRDGQCSFGGDCSNFFLKFGCTFDCHEMDVITVANGSIHCYSFINNNSSNIAYSNMTFEKCYFFGNMGSVKTPPVIFADCVGDLKVQNISNNAVNISEILPLIGSGCYRVSQNTCDTVTYNIPLVLLSISNSNFICN